MKKVLALVMALMMVVCTTSVAFATKKTEEITPYSTGVIYEYQNDNLTDSSVREFKASMGGKLRLGFAGIPRDGKAGGNITVILEVKNALGQYSELYRYTFSANKDMVVKTPGNRIYSGDSCRLIITKSGTNKAMIVAGYVGVYD